MHEHGHAHPGHLGRLFGHLFHGHATFEGRSSRAYDVMARRSLRPLYQRIAQDITLAAPAGGSLLDIGTGPGVLLTEIARERPDLQLTGLDRSEDMITAARHNIHGLEERVSVRVADVTTLPFGDDSFDAVVTSFSAHHWDDVEAAAAEVARVLRPRGRLFVYDFKRGPFDTLDAAMRARWADASIRHTTIRTGQLHLRHCVRHVVTAGARD